jgi:hypothetical protein
MEMKVVIGHRADLGGTDRFHQALERSRPDCVGEKIPGGASEGTILVELGGGQVHCIGQRPEETNLIFFYRSVHRRTGSGGVAPSQGFDRSLGRC